MAAALAACGGCAFGAAGLPPLAGAALARARRRLRKADEARLRGRGGGEAGYGGAPGTERARDGRSCRETAAGVRGGRLCGAAAGLPAEPLATGIPSASGAAGAGGGVFGPGARLLGAAVLGLAFGWIALQASRMAGASAPPSPSAVFRCGLAVLCWTAMWVALAAAALCDVAERLIPRETCWVIGGAGLACQCMVGGVASLGSGAAFALFAVAACAALNGFGRRFRDGPMVGGGDVRCMAALSVASGPLAAAGFAACFSVAAVVALAGCAAGRWGASTPLPLAPFLCLWLAVGAGGSIAPL